MGRTVSGQNLRAGQHEFGFKRNESLLKRLADGPRFPQKDKRTVSVESNLVARTTSKTNQLSLVAMFETEFKKFAGKYADTAEIFKKVIARNEKQKTEEVVAL